MKTRIKNIVTVLFVSCGILMLFCSVNICENGKIKVWECIIGCSFAIVLMFVGFLMAVFFSTLEENESLTAENEQFQNQNIQLVNRLHEAEPIRPVTKIYQNKIHTPLTYSELYPYDDDNYSYNKHGELNV